MKSEFRYLLLLLFLGVGLAACTPCDPTFYMPANLSPPNNSVTGSLRPTLSWDYEPGACLPQEFIINLFTNSTNGTISPSGFGGPTGSSDKMWEPSGDLTTGVAYLWSVAAKNGTLIGPYSEQWQFVVGPICETVDLVAPNPVEPPPPNTVTTNDPKYVWSYPDTTCAPEGYYLQVSETSDFSSLTVDDRQTDPAQARTTGVLLDDCETYHWRVAATKANNDGPWSAVSDFFVQTGGSCFCLVTDLEFIEMVPLWPPPYEIVEGLRPVLQWSKPEVTCEIGGYSVQVSPRSDMSEDRLFGESQSEEFRTMELKPATQYWWQIFPDAGDESGPPTEMMSFFTGPECADISEVGAPEILLPGHGAEITEDHAMLKWQPGGEPACIPDGYQVDLQPDPSFGGTSLVESPDNPTTEVDTGPVLEDCMTYYLRVAAIQDGEMGPYSETRWFRTNISGARTYSYYPARVLENVNCRLCGDRRCAILYIFEKGDIAQILGRSLNLFFYKLSDPNGRICYGASDFFKPDDDVDPEEDFPIVRMPPTPTVEPTDTPTPEPEPLVCQGKLSRDECEEAGGKWNLRTNSCDCPQ